MEMDIKTASGYWNLKKEEKKKEDKGMIDPIATQVSVSVGVSFKMESHF